MRYLLSLLSIFFLNCITKDATPVFKPVPIPVKEVVVEGLNKPWSITFLSEELALVSEKNGALVKVNLISQTKTSIKGFPSDLKDSIGAIEFGDNAGIFDVLIDPNYNQNKRIFIAYAAEKLNIGSTTKFISARLANDSLTDIQTILVAAPFTQDNFHYGGGMAIGTDQKLYLTVGERLYWENDEPTTPIAQDLNDPRGKIHRFNLDGSIPKDNPLIGKGAITSIYAFGIRNTQGIALNPSTQSLWFTEHGTIQGDELNLLQSGGNYGWPSRTTGKLRSKTYKPPVLADSSVVEPVWYWQHTVAPTGLCFYTGTTFPQWTNSLFVPGLSRGSLWRFKLDEDVPISAEELFLDSRVRSRKIAQSPAGKLYLLTDEENGKIIEIKPKTNEL